MPVKTAKRLAEKVDLNRNGYLDANEIGELFEDLEQTETKNKLLMIQLVIAAVFLGVSILANLGTAWYAAEAHTTMGSHASASSAATEMLTNKAGTPLRVDRTLDQHPMGSLLPDSAFQSLQYLSVTGPTGSLRMQVTATARFALATAQYDSVVVVYTSLGSVEFDGTNMLMTDITADAFHRAGFITTKSRRSDSHNPHGRFVRDVSAIMGFFSALSEMELSEFSKTTDANGNKIIPFANNPTENLTDVYVEEEIFFACDGPEGGGGALVNCDDGVVGESLVEFEDALGDTHKYLKRTKRMMGKELTGPTGVKLMVTYAETTMNEYPGARLVDKTVEGFNERQSYVESLVNAKDTVYYCDYDTNTTVAPSLPMPAGDVTARPAVQRNTEKMELTYAGNEPFFGVDARKYWITEDGVSPWTDEPKAMIAVYEHALESRPYAYSVSPLQQTVWKVIGAASLAPKEFAKRAAKSLTATDPESFMEMPATCGDYRLAAATTIMTNKTLRDARAPAPLSYYRSAMLLPKDFVYIIADAARLRRTALAPGEDGHERHQREVKDLFRGMATELTPRQKEHIFQGASTDTEKFLDQFARSAILQFEDHHEEEHFRMRRSEFSAPDQARWEARNPAEEHSPEARRRRSHFWVDKSKGVGNMAALEDENKYGRWTRKKKPCTEVDSTVCHPWGTGANTEAETIAACSKKAGSGKFLNFADCCTPYQPSVSTKVSTCPTTPGYGWVHLTGTEDEIKPTVFQPKPNNNPYTCQEDQQACMGGSYDFKVIQVDAALCGPDPIQYFSQDPENQEYYMCRETPSVTGEISVTKEFGLVYGICRPSISATGKFGNDASCTMFGSLAIAGTFSCEISGFGFTLKGGATLTFELEIYDGFAQSSVGIEVFVELSGDDETLEEKADWSDKSTFAKGAHNAGNAWLSGGADFTVSEMSWSCCYQRQPRLTANYFIQINTFLFSGRAGGELYNGKFGEMLPPKAPKGCNDEALSNCDCAGTSAGAEQEFATDKHKTGWKYGKDDEKYPFRYCYYHGKPLELCEPCVEINGASSFGNSCASAMKWMGYINDPKCGKPVSQGGNGVEARFCVKKESTYICTPGWDC